MPLYLYQVVTPDGSEGEIFEVLQEIDEPFLTQHPESGLPVVKLLSTPRLASKHSELGTRASLSPGNLARHGFTQYQKAGGGHYEKTAGRGPDVLGSH